MIYRIDSREERVSARILTLKKSRLLNCEFPFWWEKGMKGMV